MSHNHDHHHSSCGCKSQASFEPQDAAGRSLAGALKTSFTILKIIMIVLVLLFLCSGIFNVQENEQALVLIFGKVRGLGDERVLNPGLNFTWPEPVSEIIRIPVKKVQTVSINSFWYFQTPEEIKQEALGQKSPFFSPSLDPVKDGYCLTRNESLADLEGMDYNIVHSKWTLTYFIDQPELFFENVFYPQPRPGEDFLEVASKTVRPLLESLASNAIVATLSHYTIDDAVTSNTDISLSVKNILQTKLDAIHSGIRIDSIRADRIMWPRQVDDAFQASNRARQESEQARIDAWSYKEKLLTDTAGADGEAILEKIKQAGVSQEQKEQFVTGLKGQVQSRISEAKAYRTSIVEEAKANADYLLKLLPEYNKRPELVLQKLYQDTIEQVMAEADEKILVQPTPTAGGRELRIQINREIKPTKKQENNQSK